MIGCGLLLCVLACLAICAVASQHVAFDGASASSVYSAGSSSGYPAFAAPQALSPSSGYWCSAGGHAPEEVVSWTGVLSARRKVVGVKLDWAYSPGEFKILASADGANFVETACWRSAARSDVAYAEYVMFDTPTALQAMTVVMRAPRSWGYFGINSASLLALPGPSIVVSGATSSTELCMLASSAGDLHLSPCVSAMSAGVGHEVFVLAESGLLASGLDAEECVTLAEGDVSGGGRLVMGSCRAGSDAADGRNVFEITPAGQLKLAKMGGYCVTATGLLAEKDLATGASVMASSTQPQHPASDALDGNPSTFWASASDPSERAPVDLTIGLGGAAHIALIEIDWELPAKSFEVQASLGGAYSALHTTQTNSLNKTVVVADGAAASSIRLRMKEPHPVWGAAGSDFAYGVRAVRIIGSTAAVVVQDCAEAAESADARDKFFMVAVPEFDASGAASAQASAELAVKAGDRLAGLLARLVSVMPTLENCALRKAVEPANAPGMLALHLRAGQSMKARSQAYAASDVEKFLGVDGEALTRIIRQAKDVVSAVHSAL